MNLSQTLEQAVQLHRQGRLHEAERLYAAVLEAQPDHFDATHLMGVLCSQQGRNQEALDHLGACLRIRPDDVPALLNLGIALTKLNRPDAALENFDKAVRLQPDFAEAHYNRGNALRALQRPHDALACYERAIALNPRHAEAFNNRGTALSDLQRWDEALASYDKAIALNPQYAEAHSNRGNVLRRQGRLAEAGEGYLRALRLNPNYSEIAEGIGIVERDGYRSLHLGTPSAQSTIRLSSPFELQQAHQRGLMAFLLFKPQPRDLLAIGLGGGCLANFIHRYCLETRTRIVEIDPRIIAVARSHFGVPADDERLQVIASDGVDYLRDHTGAADVLIVDMFDGMGAPSGLYTPAFFDSCAAALKPDGVLAFHLWRTDRNFDAAVQMLRQSFAGGVLVLPLAGSTSTIVFGFCGGDPPLPAGLAERARQLEAEYKLEFKQFVEQLRESNPQFDR